VSRTCSLIYDFPVLRAHDDEGWMFLTIPTSQTGERFPAARPANDLRIASIHPAARLQPAPLASAANPFHYRV